MNDKMEQFVKWVEESDNIVFFGGAGVSTESGIPDFRSVDGLYHQKYDYPPETILSHTFFYQNPAYFFRFYREKMLPLDYQPNEAHKKLAALEQAGKLRAIVTQNIDGLHQSAGSTEVYELHGSVHRNFCTRCGRFYDLAYLLRADGVPRCADDGAVVKPDVVLYEETLDETVVKGALDAISGADTMIVVGTSLVVYPAAAYVRYFRGDTLALINLAPTAYDSEADIAIHDDIIRVVGWLREK